MAVPFYTGTVSVRRAKVFRLTDPSLSWEHPGGGIAMPAISTLTGRRKTLATTSVTSLESVLKRDQVFVLSGVVALVALAWAYLFYLAQSTSGMGSSWAMAMAMAQLNQR